MDEPGIVLVSTGYGVALTQSFVDTLIAKFEGNSSPTTDSSTSITATTPTNNTATTANVPPIGKVKKYNFREKQSFAFIQFEDPQVILNVIS